jgi:hypothetical protein
VRDCLQGNVTYIGTSAMVGWHESTVFSSAFYGAPFSQSGIAGDRGVQPPHRSQLPVQGDVADAKSNAKAAFV